MGRHLGFRGALGTFVAAVVVAVGGLAGTGHALTSTTQPTLTINRLIRTSPFAGSSTAVRDNEDLAYIPSDDSLWMADDNGKSIYEVDRTTGALKRTVSRATFSNSRQFGGSALATNSRDNDLEAVAYDRNADVLYAFSGSTSSTPTVYRFLRDGSHNFQIDSWQPLPTEWTGAGWRPADGKVYVADASSIRTYDYVSNTFGPAFSVSGLSTIYDIAFDPATGDLLAVSKAEKLFRVNMTTHAFTPGWGGLDLTQFGMLDTRGVEVIGEQVFVSDGFDYRSASDPMNHAIFVYDVTGPGSTPAPTAAFTASPTSGTAPLAVSFSDTSTGAPTSWAWTFGDGGTSTSRNPSHTYVGAGTFTATLTATNGGGPSTTSKTISVSAAATAPTASFTASPSSGTAPLPVTFTDTSTGAPTSWAWTFGDGGTSTSQNPSHTFTTNGTYTVQLTATNAQGPSSTTRTVTVSNAPPPPTTVALDADSYFNTASPTKNYGGYTVMKLHGPSAEYRPIVKFTLSGLSGPPSSVKIRLFVTDASTDCGSWSRVDNGWTETGVNWNNQPAIVGSPVAAVGSCTAGTWVDVDVTSAITGNGTYSFAATSGSTNTAQFSSREGTNPPQVAIVASGSVGTPAPTAAFTASPSSGSAPLPVSFTDTSTGAPTSWAWTFGDGASSTVRSPSHTYTSAGTFTATLTATNAGGSTSTSKTIAVNAAPVAPTASFNASPTSGTAPLLVSFTDTSTGAPTSWAWTFGDGGNVDEPEPESHLHREWHVHRAADRDEREGLDLSVEDGHRVRRTAATLHGGARRGHVLQHRQPHQELRDLRGDEVARSGGGVPADREVHAEWAGRSTGLGEDPAVRHRRERRLRQLVPGRQRLDRGRRELEQQAGGERQPGGHGGQRRRRDLGRGRRHARDHRQRDVLVRSDVRVDEHGGVLESRGRPTRRRS